MSGWLVVQITVFAPVFALGFWRAMRALDRYDMEVAERWRLLMYVGQVGLMVCVVGMVAET